MMVVKETIKRKIVLFKKKKEILYSFDVDFLLYCDGTRGKTK